MSNESNYLAPAKASNLGNISRNGSEADSLLDLYSRSRSGEHSMDAGDRKTAPGGHPGDEDDEDPERAYWIHRDKLLRIENQEMEQAGIRVVGRKSRSQSRSDSRSLSRTRSRNSKAAEGSRDRYGSLTSENEPWPATREEKRQKFTSPPPEEEEDEARVEEQRSWDLRTPEEIARDPFENGQSDGIYKNPQLRKSSSRIPVFSSSPMPIPQGEIERDRPRKRNASGTFNSPEEGGFVYNKVRSRSQSVGSQVLLDEETFGTPTRANRPGSRPASRGYPPVSPVKPKSPAKVSAAPGTRKPSSTAPRNASAPVKNRAASSASKANSPSARPGTRSGEGRPSTAINRPEGDPPWLATMYKPDPRLPPDQQMLPTHAKRLQQEQWEKEGKPGTTYDRDFAPLAIHTDSGLQRVKRMEEFQPASAPSDENGHRNEEQQAWPLRVDSKTSDMNARPGTSGGYSTMPKVQNRPPVGAMASPRPVQQPMKVQEPSREDDKAGKGCGCCLVM